MRSFGIYSVVCLAAMAIASPTPVDPDSLDTWSPPPRRDIFSPREPGSLAAETREAEKRSPLMFTLPLRLPISGSFNGLAVTPAGFRRGSTVTFGHKTTFPNGEGNNRYPFFFKRHGLLEAVDIEELDALKVKIQTRDAEDENARREADERAAREAEERAAREAEEQAARDAEERAAHAA